MVAGHTQEKRGYFYIVLNYKVSRNRQLRPWPSLTSLTGDVLFADFMLSWLDVIKRSVSPVTFSSYSEMVKGITVPYFRKTGISSQP